MNRPSELGYLVLGLMALLGCSSTAQLGSTYVKSGAIGPSGGSLTIEPSDVSGTPAAGLVGTSITIPAGALLGTTTIQIGLSRTALTLPAGGIADGPVVDFEPSGTAFAVPVAIRLPVSAPSGSTNQMIDVVESNGSSSQVAAQSVANGLATFQAHGFSFFGGFTRGTTLFSDGGVPITITTLPTNGTTTDFTKNTFAIDLATDGRIGVAYYWDDGQTNHDLDYFELETDGSTQSAHIDVVQQVYGVSLRFDATGTPAVSYLGQDPAFVTMFAGDGGGLVFWTQSNLAVAFVRSFADGGVEHTYPAHLSSDVSLPGDPLVDTTGDVVGLDSAMVLNDGELLDLYRDIHDGQFPVQDFGDSCWDAAVQDGGGWLDERILAGAGQTVDPRGGLGALNGIAVGPAGVGAICSSEANLLATPQDIVFALQANGVWQDQSLIESVNDVGPAGASIAGDPAVGFGVAWVEMSPNMGAASSILSYTSSLSGTNWSAGEQVYGSGAGGWEPSLAFDSNDLANIAFFVCSQANGGGSTCPINEQGLWMATRRAPSVWDLQEIDSAGGRFPKLRFDANGNMVLVYRDPATGSLKLAVSAR